MLHFYVAVVKEKWLQYTPDDIKGKCKILLLLKTFCVYTMFLVCPTLLKNYLCLHVYQQLMMISLGKVETRTTITWTTTQLKFFPHLNCQSWTLPTRAEEKKQPENSFKINQWNRYTHKLYTLTIKFKTIYLIYVYIYIQNICLIQDACKEGIDPTFLEVLLSVCSSLCDVNGRDEHGRTGLHTTCASSSKV